MVKNSLNSMSNLSLPPIESKPLTLLMFKDKHWLKLTINQLIKIGLNISKLKMNIRMLLTLIIKEL